MADSYASRSELASALGIGSATGLDDRLDLALLVASRWVDYRVGNDVTEEDITLPITESEGTDGPDVVACPPSWKAATLVAATRFYKSADVPFGVAGGLGDLAVTVKQSIPEAEVILFGQRLSWGIA